MKPAHEMSDDEAAEKLSRLLVVGGKEMRIGLLPQHAEIKRWKPCRREFRTGDGDVVKCGRVKSPHYCEPRVAQIMESWNKLKLVRPPHLDEPFVPIHWNREKIDQLYGVVVADKTRDMWLRNYNMVYIVGTRGGLKTVFLSGNGMVFLLAAPPGTEMVLVSQTEERTEQTVAGYMKDMIKVSPALQKAGIEWLQSKQKFARRDPKRPDVECRIMSTRTAGSALGQRLGLIIVDEFDAVPNLQEFWSDATYSWGLQPEPIALMASTVSKDYASYEAEMTEKMRDVLERPWLDARTIPVLNIAEEGADWRDREVWHEVNFHIGLGLLDPAILDSEYQRALGDPVRESEFARFRVGVRLSPHSSYIPMSIWDMCHPVAGFETLEAIDEEMAVWPVFLGVDFAEVSDWTACVACCMDGRGRLFLRGWYWIPRTNIPVMDKRLGGRVSQWIAEGHLRIQEPEDIGIRQVAEEIARIAERYPDMRAIGYDQTKALAARTLWEEEGLFCDSVAQGYRIQEGAKEIKYRAMEIRDNPESKLIHGGDPVMRYFFESAELHRVGTQEQKMIEKPERDKSARRVDGAVAAATAVYMRLLHFQYAPGVGAAGSTGARWADLEEDDDNETTGLVLP